MTSAASDPYTQSLIARSLGVPLDEHQLFFHVKRPEWGPAMLVGVEMTRRSYQFQDGRLRKLKKGYYHLMESYEVSDTRRDVLRDELSSMSADLSMEAERRQRTEGPTMTFAQQVKVFRSLFPGGFRDEAYMAAWRRDGRRVSKRHAERALAAANQLLNRERLEVGDGTQAFSDLLQVLNKTSLAAPTKDIRPLEVLGESARENIGAALAALLYGDAPLDERMLEWIVALDADGAVSVTWPMATLPLALLEPSQHICVRRKIFQLQSVVLGIGSSVGDRPTSTRYKSAQKMARRLWERLDEEGLEPQDMMDVHHFIWETLRPSGQARLRSIRG